MKKYLYFSIAALALVSCSDDEYIGGTHEKTPTDTAGAILFQPSKGALTRGDIYGSEAAKLLGNNFIVEGTKGELPNATTTTNVVFDNYLVVFEENTAGTTESNTHNWEYVGVDHSDQMTAAILNGTDFGRGVDQQTIKYWDYSVPQYDFVAYSTGDKKMVNTTPTAGQVQVTKIDGTAKSYSFTGLSAADLSSVYVTDVVTVEKANYGQPVVLKFKNLTSKVRMALYETVPGYSVKDVEFFADDATTTVTYTAATVPADQTELDAANATAQLYTEAAGVYTAYTTYDSGVSNVYTAKSTTSDVATLFNTASALPTSGTIDVTYPHTGTTHRDATPQTEDYNKANVTVTVGASKSNTQEFNALADNTLEAPEHNEPAGAVYLGRTSNDPTFAGALADNYYQAVIPNPEGQSLTLRVNYTLVSTDGSNEEIKVWGAKAIVPATYTKWQPNYAYTYIFKISDKSNGSTDKLGGVEGLFPITFDAVVAQATDASAEQTTITTVATPSITTYQKGHNYADTDSYLASKGLIYVMVKGSTGDLAEDLDTKGQLYTVTGSAISEASVTDALLKQVTATTPVTVQGRNGIALTDASTAASVTVGNTYVNLEGNTVTITGKVNCVASFTPLADTYAYVYKVADATAAGTYTVYQPKSYAVDADVAGLKSISYATIAGTADLTANETADKDYLYFQVTKDGAGTVTNYSYITVIPGKTLVAAGEGVKKIAKSSLTTEAAGAKAVANTFYFDTYDQNDAQYGVKVIKVQ